MKNVINLMPIIEQRRTKECEEFLIKRIPNDVRFSPVIEETFPDWLYLNGPKKVFDLTIDQELLMDVADELTGIAAEFIHMANRLNAFAARIKDGDDAA